MEEDQRELQLLPTPHYSIASSSHMNLDLQLSISLTQPPQLVDNHRGSGGFSVKALKWQASEQIRLASIEKAYAERVRELTRREMELAQSEFARARHMWERAKQEVDKAERIKQITCMAEEEDEAQITCRNCRQRFRPLPCRD